MNKVPDMKSKRKKEEMPILHIDADPDNADWLHIVRAERIARQVPDGEKRWAEAIQKAGGNRSAALPIFYRLLEESGIEVY
jgi:hypothetical protein